MATAIFSVLRGGLGPHFGTEIRAENRRRNQNLTLQRHAYPRMKHRIQQFGAFFWGLVFLAIPRSHGATEADFEARARHEYNETRTKQRGNPGNPELFWKFACACFNVAEFASDSEERADFAQQGMEACHHLIDHDPSSAPGHYYLGMNMGQLARTRGIGALKIVTQMEPQFQRARELDEKFDYAGPDRNLGLLYFQAPRIGSIGSRSKAHTHLQKAVDLAPDYPENHLNLLEAFIKWSDRNGAHRELKALTDLWPKAKTNYTGQRWEASWIDWTKRLEQAKKKVEAPSRTIEAPSHRD